MNKILIQFTIFVLALIAFTGCSMEEEKTISTQESLRLNLTMGTFKNKTDVKTKATEESNQDGAFNEDKINSLDIFFFKGNLLKLHVSSSSGELMYDQEENQAVIPVGVEENELFANNTDEYDIYVIANNKANLNSIAAETTTSEELKNLVFQTNEFITKGGNEAQTDFLMDGLITKVVNMKNPILGTVELKRAASKIRLRLLGVAVPGYTLDNSQPIQAELVHFTDKSVLIEGGNVPTINKNEWKRTDLRDVATTLEGFTGKTTAAPFYAYENDWNTDSSKETYISLYVPLKSNSSNTTEIYKYSIPVTPTGLTGELAQYMNRLDRNHLYDIEVSVNILGGHNDKPVDLTANYQIKDWGTKEILIDIRASHFLITSERHVRMPNITYYKLTYISSTPNVSIVDNSLIAQFVYTDQNGVVQKVDAAGDQVPTVVLTPDPNNPTIGTIEITSKVPINYLIKHVSFEVTNGKITNLLTMEQLPPIYFTVEKGIRSKERPTGNWDKEGSGNPATRNPYIYVITILVPHDGLHIGYPKRTDKGWTTNTGEVARMISPRFMMASQLGETDANLDYTVSAEHCTQYWEQVEGKDPYAKGEWRLPTEAELKLIDDLQNDPNNIQGYILTNNRYWDNWDATFAWIMKDPLTWDSKDNQPKHLERAAARCVRDILN